MDIQAQIRRLEAACELSPEQIEEAREYVKECVYALSLSASFLSSIVISTHRNVYTQAIDTMAVTLGADGFAMLLVDPRFALKLRDEPAAVDKQAKFILAHEAYHLVNRHLYANEYRGDDVWTLACEATINRRVMKLMNMQLPQIDGQPSGVDPKKVYQSYRRDLKKQGLEPVSEDEFFATDMGCYSEMKRMSSPPGKQRGHVMVCQHGSDGKAGGAQASGQCSCDQPGNQAGDQSGSGSGSDESGDQSGSGSGSGSDESGDQSGSGQGDPSGQGSGSGSGGNASGSVSTDPNCPVHGLGKILMDQEQVDDLVSNALEIAVHEARANNNPTAKKELLELADQSAGSERASRMWGDLGVGALRGETVSTRKTQWWHTWVEQKLADRLEPGMRLVRQRKIWWEEQLRYNGDEPNMVVDVFVDASGSMRQSDLDWISRRCGETEGLTVRWHSFDAAVWPFELGEPFRGGGGTSFQIIDDHVNDDETLECCDVVEPDAVLVVTDGHAPRITPRDPDKWVWLITPGGSTWPEQHDTPMDCYEIDTASEPVG